MRKMSIIGVIKGCYPAQVVQFVAVTAHSEQISAHCWQSASVPSSKYPALQAHIGRVEALRFVLSVCVKRLVLEFIDREYRVSTRCR